MLESKEVALVLIPLLACWAAQILFCFELEVVGAEVEVEGLVEVEVLSEVEVLTDSGLTSAFQLLSAPIPTPTPGTGGALN